MFSLFVISFFFRLLSYIFANFDEYRVMTQVEIRQRGLTTVGAAIGAFGNRDNGVFANGCCQVRGVDVPAGMLISAYVAGVEGADDAPFSSCCCRIVLTFSA